MGFLIDKKTESIITNLPYVMLYYNKLINYQSQPIKIDHWCGFQLAQLIKSLMVV